MDTKQSYINRSPEEKRAYVDAQIAAGNKKYMPRDKWLEKNAVPIAIRNLQQEVSASRLEMKDLKDQFLKFLKSK